MRLSLYNSKKPVVGVDIDNVLNNLAEATLTVYNRKYNDNLILTDIVSYDMSKFVKEEARADFVNLYASSETWELVEFRNLKALLRLMSISDVYIVTSTAVSNLGFKAELLQKNIPSFDVFNRLVRMPPGKKNLLKLDYLIDDSPAELAGGSFIPVCYDYPWNHNFSEGMRIKALDDFVNYLEKNLQRGNSSLIL